MFGLRLFYTGLAGIMALNLGTESSVHAQAGCSCAVVAPEQISQAQILNLGQAYFTPSYYPPGSNVTDIVRIFNRTPCHITLRKVDAFGVENRDQRIDIAPGAAYRGSMWVPWADDWNSPQRLQLVIANRSYLQIWQKGKRVAFRTEPEIARLRHAGQLQAQYDAAPSVPGFYASGGRRHLYVVMTSDGRPFFRLVGTDE